MISMHGIASEPGSATMRFSFRGTIEFGLLVCLHHVFTIFRTRHKRRASGSEAVLGFRPPLYWIVLQLPMSSGPIFAGTIRDFPAWRIAICNRRIWTFSLFQPDIVLSLRSSKVYADCTQCSPINTQLADYLRICQPIRPLALTGILSTRHVLKAHRNPAICSTSLHAERLDSPSPSTHVRKYVHG
jgi:hypothetical protein